MLSRMMRANFISRMKGKSLVEIVDACRADLEFASSYEPQDQVEVTYRETFRQFLLNLYRILTVRQRPADIEDFELQKTKPIIEQLVAHKEVEPEILNMYLG